MKNIIKEIIENLWKNISYENKKKFQSALEFLMKMKPDIKPDPKFKKNLRQKLENLISLNGEPKTSFLSFLVPITSALFVFGFLYYSFDDTFFTQGPANIDILREKTLIDEEIQTIEDIFLEEVEKAETQQNMLKSKSAPTPSIIQTKEVPVEKKSRVVIPEVKESFPVESDDTEVEIETPSIEDTQIIDILWDEEDLSDIPESSLQMKWMWWTEADMSIDSFMVQPESGTILYIQEFEEFCKSASGALSEWDDWTTCKWESIECSLEDYLNQNCNWKKKN